MNRFVLHATGNGWWIEDSASGERLPLDEARCVRFITNRVVAEQATAKLNEVADECARRIEAKDRKIIELEGAISDD